MPSSPRFISRLLTLLLVLLSGIIGAHMVTGSPAILNLGNIVKFSNLTGGTAVRRSYYLISKCSEKYIRMKPRHKKRPVDAKGLKQGARSEVEFLSYEHNGKVMIYGVRAERYLCFSKTGRLITREKPGRSDRCKFKELPTENGTELQSMADRRWFVGFKKNGKPLKGHQRRIRRFEKCFAFHKIPKVLKRHPSYGPLTNVDKHKLSDRLNRQRHRYSHRQSQRRNHQNRGR